MKEVRLGIVGLGNMGRTHRQYILDGKITGLAVTALCGRPAAMATLPEHPGESRFSHIDDMISSGTVDAVLCCTPHPTHTPIGIAVLEAGLHLLMEKPLGVHVADCQRLLAAHTDPSRVFAAMFQVRTDPHYTTLKQLIDSGETGAVQRILWDTTNWFRTESYYGSASWRATWRGEGGGILLNQLPHNLDVFQWIFGRPSQVTGFCQFGRHHHIEVEDDVTVHCRWPDGRHATLIASTGEAPGRNRLEIACDRGHITVESGKITWLKTLQPVREFSDSTAAAFAQPDTETIEIPIDGRGPGHLAILQNFTNAILHGEPLLCPASEGVHSVELANAALLSTWLGRTIDLPIDAAAYAQLLAEKAESSTFQKKQITSAPASAQDFAQSYQR
jgi:predicted dehydrogenase